MRFVDSNERLYCIMHRSALLLSQSLHFVTCGTFVQSLQCYSWGRILERNWYKSLASFPPCYSQSPLLLPLPLEHKWFKLVCNVNMYMEASSLRTLNIMPGNLNETVRSWIRLLYFYRRDPIIKTFAISAILERLALAATWLPPPPRPQETASKVQSWKELSA